MTQEVEPDQRPAAKIVFADRLLAEAVRHLEQDGVAPCTEPAVLVTPDGEAASFETRIVARAMSLEAARALRDRLGRIQRLTVLSVAVLAVVAAIAGAAATRAAFSETSINVFWALTGLLGVQTVFLTAWVVLVIRGPSVAAGFSLGRLAAGLAQRISERHAVTGPDVAALRATSLRLGGPVGRWSLSAISHALWSVFNAACLGLLLLMLSARHYRFGWETTILSADAYNGLTRLLAWAPSRLGFPTPSAEQIDASEGAAATGDDEALRHAWSGFVVGCVTVYGLTPRVGLAFACFALAARRRRGYRLDTSRPGYQRLRDLLLPTTRSLGVVEAASNQPVPPVPSPPVSTGGAGVPAVVGVEVEPVSGWPPPFGDLPIRDLGVVDDRSDRRRVLEQVDQEPKPRSLLVVCDLTSTPDRGLRSLLSALITRAAAPVSLVLTGGQALRLRTPGGDLQCRVEDWRGLATSAGVPADRIVEIDLDHLTRTTEASLAALVTTNPTLSPGERHIEAALDVILEHVRRWPESPGRRAQGALHNAIGGIYRDRPVPWASKLSTPESIQAGSLKDAMREGARQVRDMLPSALRVQPRWIAAGGLAGGLSCIAVATLVSPAAIAALPIWSVLGMVLGVAGAAGVATRTEPSDTPEVRSEIAEAVRAATLHALVLELQGRGETVISRVLEGTLEESLADQSPSDAELVERWLTAIRHRYDIALAAETSP